MITRKYETIKECTRCWLTEDWNMLDSNLITENDDWCERWSFRCANEEGTEWYDPDDESETTWCDVPMWSTWFEPCVWDLEWIEEHEVEVAKLGFTLIYHDDELWGVGIDGAGFDFYEYFWMPLYKARGLKWHE